MEHSIRSTDNTTPGQDVDRVHGMQPSAQNRERKFARALKEKMDEEKKKRQEQGDELVLHEEPTVPADSESDHDQEEQATNANDRDDETDSKDGVDDRPHVDDRQHADDRPHVDDRPHIDLKA